LITLLLPESQKLPVHLLAACFNKTTATYKFYWLLSILQAIEEGRLRVTKKELFSRMISNAWFTVNYFHVSFGKHDLIQEAIHSIHSLESITIDEKRELVFQKLFTTKNTNTEKLLWHFDRNVPHWFLSPWFPTLTGETEIERKKRTYHQSQTFSSFCLYALYNEHIDINPVWKDYLLDNAKLLKNFCYWNLALFLQTRNPNVPDIPNKLIRPATRNSLTKQRTQFWDVVFDELGSIECIYTGLQLKKEEYAVEHFIPYSFVSHDLIWNLLPANPSFNSAKGNKLPLLDRYFSPFFKLQKNAYEIVMDKFPKNKLLEEYHTVLGVQEKELNERRFLEVIQPLVTIASKNGLQFM
jgi:hypothetical protein